MCILYMRVVSQCFSLEFDKGMQRNCGPLGNITTCCIPSKNLQGFNERYILYINDRIVNFC